jgi:hypothetical protein
VVWAKCHLIVLHGIKGVILVNPPVQMERNDEIYLNDEQTRMNTCLARRNLLPCVGIDVASV